MDLPASPFLTAEPFVPGVHVTPHREGTMAYVGRKPCGCAVAATVDDNTTPQETADDVRGFILRGYAIERVPVPADGLFLQVCLHQSAKEHGLAEESDSRPPAPLRSACVEQWLREHDVYTVHKPHPGLAANDYLPWQAFYGREARSGRTEEDACAALAQDVGLAFDPDDQSLLKRTPATLAQKYVKNPQNP